MGAAGPGKRGYSEKADTNRAKRAGHDRLTDVDVRNAKADGAPYKLSDGRGMYLLVQPHGARLWRLKYRLGGKEKVYAIGVYDEVSLADARVKRDAARKLISEGKDPTVERRVRRATAGATQGITFRSIADEWIARQKYSDAHRAAQRKRLDGELLPYLGDLPLAEITPAIALDALRRVERRGALETAAKCRRMGSQIARYAIQSARAGGRPVRRIAGRSDGAGYGAPRDHQTRRDARAVRGARRRAR